MGSNTTRRRRSAGATRARGLIAGLVTCLIVGGVLVTSARTPSAGLPGQGAYHVNLELPSAGNLRPRNEVRIAGVRVGEVLSVNSDGSGARVALRLDPTVRPLHTDTRALIRGKGLLGQRFVQLIPGDATANLHDDATLVERNRTSLLPDIPSVLETFDSPTRNALHTSVNELGRGFVARGGDLGDAVAAADDVAEDGNLVYRKLLANRSALDRFVPALAEGVQPLYDTREEFAAGLQPTSQWLDAIVARRGDVQSALGALPSTLSSLRSGTDASQPMLDAAGGLARAANRTLPKAPNALRAATRLLRDAPAGLKPARALFAAVKPTARPARKVLREARPVLPATQRTLTAAEPLVTDLGRYGCDIRGWAANWRSMLAHATTGEGKYGPITSLRVALVVSPETATGGTSSQVLDPTHRTLTYPDPCMRYGDGPPSAFPNLGRTP